MFDGNNLVVDATPKALEILCVLVEAGGRLVSKEEILKRVWADSFVEEANLSHHIFRLRRALGETAEHKFIETVPKRGYRFVAPIGEAKTDEQDLKTDGESASQISDSNRVSDSKLQNPRLTNRSRGALTVLAATLFVFAAGAAAFVLLNSRHTRSVDQTQNLKSEAGAPMTISLVTNHGKSGAATISRDGKFIVYTVGYTNGENTLYIRQTDTNDEAELLRLTDMTFGATAFSPDGAYVYYIAYDKRDTDGALYRVSVLGGEPTRILGNINYFFTISPDSVRVAFFRTDRERKQTSIIIARLDGSGAAEQIVTTFDDRQKSTDSVPAFSPDGMRLAFALADEPNAVDLPPERVGVYTIEIGSGTIKKLTDEKWLGIGMMNWMPDASGLVFVGFRPRVRNQIYFVSYPAGDVRRVTKELGNYGNYGMGVTSDGKTMLAVINESSPQLWSIGSDGNAQNAVQLTTGEADGSRGLAALPDGGIVYTSRTGFDYDLWMMRDADGKREGKPLVSDALYAGEPVAAPDGKFLIFISDRAGSKHLFRIDEDGTNLKQLTAGESLDNMPDISPNGEWIAYASLANNENRIWKMPASGERSPVQLTNHECVAPSISPDGKLLACVVPSESRAKPARLDIVSFETGAILKSFDVLPFDHYYCPPRWTPDGAALIYRRNDKPVGNLWRQNFAGGAPVQITDFKSDMIYNFAVARDGKSILLSRGIAKSNIVMLKNFKPD